MNAEKRLHEAGRWLEQATADLKAATEQFVMLARGELADIQAPK